MNKMYKSEACALIHNIAEDLHEDGVINSVTMSDFDEICLSLSVADIELKLDEADRAAAFSDIRYSHDEVFSRLKAGLDA